MINIILYHDDIKELLREHKKTRKPIKLYRGNVLMYTAHYGIAMFDGIPDFIWNDNKGNKVNDNFLIELIYHCINKEGYTLKPENK